MRERKELMARICGLKGFLNTDILPFVSNKALLRIARALEDFKIESERTLFAQEDKEVELWDCANCDEATDLDGQDIKESHWKHEIIPVTAKEN